LRAKKPTYRIISMRSQPSSSLISIKSSSLPPLVKRTVTQSHLNRQMKTKLIRRRAILWRKEVANSLHKWEESNYRRINHRIECALPQLRQTFRVLLKISQKVISNLPLSLQQREQEL
jgi:hypothetical protein